VAGFISYEENEVLRMRSSLTERQIWNNKLKFQAMYEPDKPVKKLMKEY
jgi:hypothetical protein